MKQGKNRFLLEMATGTGKTLVAAALIRLFLRTGNAKRVLFLVDRLELEEQAKRTLNATSSRISTPRFTNSAAATGSAPRFWSPPYRPISHDNKYLKLFNPTDFQLIISDEAHRSISGGNRQIFEYFMGAKLGLTATPRDYLKNVHFSDTDPRELERRVLLSTYETFGCESGEPTFRYSLADGVRDGCLVNPVALDCRTNISTQLLSEQGFAVQAPEEEDAAIFHARDFEKRFFSDIPTSNLPHLHGARRARSAQRQDRQKHRVLRQSAPRFQNRPGLKPSSRMNSSPANTIPILPCRSRPLSPTRST